MARLKNGGLKVHHEATHSAQWLKDAQLTVLIILYGVFFLNQDLSRRFIQSGR